MNFDLDSILDFLFGLVAIATITKILPPLAATLSILWTTTRFYEYGKSILRKRGRISRTKGNKIKDDNKI